MSAAAEQPGILPAVPESRAPEARPGGEGAIKRANQELLHKTEGAMRVAVAVLIEQRDAALRQVERVLAAAEVERTSLIEEQDRFITFMMEEHEQKLDELERRLASTREDLERRQALSPQERAPEDSGPMHQAQEQVGSLQELLQAAYAEVDESRKDAARLQEERDEAIRAMDDLRLALYAEMDLVRDEAAEFEHKLDEANRRVEDARDEARDEAYRLTEQLDEQRRKLDEKEAEVRGLRERLAELRDSQPPPAAPSAELELARRESVNLRKQLIDAKREVSRISRELELLRAQRPNTGTRPAFQAQRPQTPVPGDAEPSRSPTAPGLSAPPPALSGVVTSPPQGVSSPPSGRRRWTPVGLGKTTKI